MKLGEAQKDCKIGEKKPGGLVHGALWIYLKYTIIIVKSYIYFNYDILQIRFLITILYILSALIQYCIKNVFRNFLGEARARCAPF